MTQKELAEHMDITQPMISALATLRSDVEALGGTVEVTATFGSRMFVLSPQD